MFVFAIALHRPSTYLTSLMFRTVKILDTPNCTPASILQLSMMLCSELMGMTAIVGILSKGVVKGKSVKLAAALDLGLVHVTKGMMRQQTISRLTR